jgi:hypothetical protein
MNVIRIANEGLNNVWAWCLIKQFKDELLMAYVSVKHCDDHLMVISIDIPTQKRSRVSALPLRVKSRSWVGQGCCK